MDSAAAASQSRFLGRCAEQHAATWPALSSQLYAGERRWRTAYSSYACVDGRCIDVQRSEDGASFVALDAHDCLGMHLVGFLVRHDEPDGVRWSLHRGPREGAKAVFWRADGSRTGRFVVTSRVADVHAAEPSAFGPIPTPTGGVDLRRPLTQAHAAQARQGSPRLAAHAPRAALAPPRRPPAR